jgi:putative sterol carrier protein
MELTFPSQEWTEHFIREINGSDTYASAAKNWEGDIMLAIENSGGIYLDLWHGKCRNGHFTDEVHSAKPAFKITASLDNWKKVLNNKLDPIQGLMTRQLKLDGNLVKIMQNVKAAQELVRCATKVPTKK